MHLIAHWKWSAAISRSTHYSLSAHRVLTECSPSSSDDYSVSIQPETAREHLADCNNHRVPVDLVLGHDYKLITRFNYFLIIYFNNNLLWIICRFNSISTISRFARTFRLYGVAGAPNGTPRVLKLIQVKALLWEVCFWAKFENLNINTQYTLNTI